MTWIEHGRLGSGSRRRLAILVAHSIETIKEISSEPGIEHGLNNTRDFVSFLKSIATVTIVALVKRSDKRILVLSL